MILTDMSRNDLERFQVHLRSVQIAADALATGFLEPIISLTDEGTVIRTGALFSPRGAGSVPSMAADQPALEIEVNLGQPLPSAPVIPPVNHMPAEPAPAAPATAAPVSPAAPPLEVKVGPFDVREKEIAVMMTEAGRSNADIAAHLNRRIQTVALFVSSHNARQAKLAAQRAAEAAPAPKVAATMAPVKDDAPGTVKRDPEPPVEAAADIVVPLPDPTAALTSAQRSLLSFINGLRCPKGWDAELDLELVEALAAGTKAQHVAADLGLDTQAVVDRFNALAARIRDYRGQITISGQQDLLIALRCRVAQLRQK